MIKLVPALETFFGVKRLFRPTSNAPPGYPGISGRSKFKGNKKTAARLASECPKLKRLEHWDDKTKVIVLLGGDKYEVADIQPGISKSRRIMRTVVPWL